MHIVCSYTSGYFLIYDDEYGCVHYNNDDDEYGCVHYNDDDDDHALHDIRGFADLQHWLQTASSTMTGPS